MNSAKSNLLACTAVAAALAVTMGAAMSVTMSVALAATPDAPFAAAQSRARDTTQMFAQAPTPAQIEAQKKAAEEAKKKAAPPPPPPAARPAPPPPPPAARPAPPPPPAARPAPPPPPAARPAPPPQAPVVRPAAPPPPPAARPVPPPPPQAPVVRPAAPTPPPAVQQRPVAPPPPPPPAAQQRPATPPPPAAAQDKPATPPAPPAGAQDRQRGDRGDVQRPGGPRGPGGPGLPGAPGRPGTPPPSVTPPPTAAGTATPPPAAGGAPPPAAGARPPISPATPPAAQAPGTAPVPSAARTQAAPPALAPPPPPPTAVRNSSEFIRRGNAGPSAGIADVRKRRQESRDGDRTIIREGDRTIVRGDNRTIIQHNESSRFAIGARTVRTESRGDQRVTVVERPGGVRITSYSDRDGRLTRRVRRDRNGRETVLIDNLFAGAIAGLFIGAMQPPVVRMPRETYIVDGYRADRGELYDVFIAPPVDRLEQRYTLDQVRYNAPLREYMRRVDLDVNFESGSWQLTPSQIDRLAAVADGLNRAISKNPREIFLIEGHTDTVGNPDDNLSLSDRRAEAVAVALTERFQVPSENLVTQGYGEEYPKEQVDGPSRINRRVAVRRITPLIDQTAQQ